MARSVFAIGLILALSTAAAPTFAADVPVSEEARQHFTAGVSFLQDPDGARYEEALREFQAAYAISPSWKMLGNLGIAAMKLERDGEARDAIKKYLAEGGSHIEADERAQMERDLQALEASVATIHIEATPAGASIVDERQPVTGNPVVNRYGPVQGSLDLAVRPGHHRLTAKLEGYADQVWEVDTQPRGTASHSFQLTAASAATPTGNSEASTSVTAAAPPSGNGLRIASYVAFGVGVVGLGVGTVFALKAKSDYQKANDLCPSFPCALSQQDYDDRVQFGKHGDSAKTFSLVGFIVGGVGVAAGTTMFVLSGKKHSDTPAAGKTSVYVGLGSAGVAGSF